MMSNEEWDRRVEFLLKQQARFDIDIAETNKVLAQVADNLAQQSYVMAEGFTIARAELRDLREAQKLTDEALRKFIIKVDRLTGEAQNGLQN
jgi:hypothetical protein